MFSCKMNSVFSDGHETVHLNKKQQIYKTYMLEGKFFHIQHLLHSLRIVCVWQRLSLAAWLQEPVDGRNRSHPTLESLEGNTGSL